MLLWSSRGEKNYMAKPFVKWAGGKTQLLPVIRKKYPQTVHKYCEPFVGGGAVLFDVLQEFHPSDVLINDINPELINVYNQIKTNINKLLTLLNDFQDDFLSKKDAERKEFYLTKRTTYNHFLELHNDENGLEKAALFIFLNKTCFNGLYRVNSKGFFNVPFNNAKNPLICDVENLIDCSKLLQNVTMHVGDYSSCKSFIDNKTFVYIDPPYRPLTQSSYFTSYNENGFTDKEQIELGTFITEIAKQGAHIIASNSDPKNTNKKDNFFDDLYSEFNIERINATRMINSNANKRGAISELLISNIASIL